MPMTQTLSGEEVVRVTFFWTKVQDGTKYLSSDSYYLNVKWSGKGKDENEGKTHTHTHIYIHIYIYIYIYQWKNGN